MHVFCHFVYLFSSRNIYNWKLWNFKGSKLKASQFTRYEFLPWISHDDVRHHPDYVTKKGGNTLCASAFYLGDHLGQHVMNPLMLGSKSKKGFVKYICIEKKTIKITFFNITKINFPIVQVYLMTLHFDAGKTIPMKVKKIFCLILSHFWFIKNSQIKKQLR